MIRFFLGSPYSGVGEQHYDDPPEGNRPAVPKQLVGAFEVPWHQSGGDRLSRENSELPHLPDGSLFRPSSAGEKRSEDGCRNADASNGVGQSGQRGSSYLGGSFSSEFEGAGDFSCRRLLECSEEIGAGAAGRSSSQLAGTPKCSEGGVAVFEVGRDDQEGPLVIGPRGEGSEDSPRSPKVAKPITQTILESFREQNEASPSREECHSRCDYQGHFRERSEFEQGTEASPKAASGERIKAPGQGWESSGEGVW